MKKQNKKSSGQKQSPEPSRKGKLLDFPKQYTSSPIVVGSTGIGKRELLASAVAADVSRRELEPASKKEPFIVGHDSEQKPIFSSVPVSELRFQIFKPKPTNSGDSRLRSALTTASGELRPGAVVIVIDRKRKALHEPGQ